MDQNIYIYTRYGCANISRAQHQSDGSVTYERALNSYDLSDAALAALEQQGGTRWIDGIYPCPIELAALARWTTELQLARAG